MLSNQILRAKVCLFFFFSPLLKFRGVLNVIIIVLLTRLSKSNIINGLFLEDYLAIILHLHGKVFSIIADLFKVKLIVIITLFILVVLVLISLGSFMAVPASSLCQGLSISMSTFHFSECYLFDPHPWHMFR